MELKIISYNLNGIRAAMKKGLLDWLKLENPDVFLVQETKAQPGQIDLEGFTELGYRAYFHSAVKPGYSGVAIFSKVEPDQVVTGIGLDQYDSEGRVLRADFGEISVFSTYFPSGTTGEVRQAFKMEFLTDFALYINDLKKNRPKVVIGGDFNICHKPIDIHNPIANKNSSGFLPEEREWVTSFIAMGFKDTFRMFHSEGDSYTWWTYRFGARGKNLGWRIDYHMVSDALAPFVKDAAILSDAMHSDHCPVSIVLKLE